MVRIAIPPTPAKPASHSRGSNAVDAAPFVVCPFRIAVDQRERAGGWRFDGLTEKGKRIIVPTIECHLVTADYTVIDEDFAYQIDDPKDPPKGPVDPFCLPVRIERKSGDDLLGSIGGERERFEREHERLRDEIIAVGGFAAVVVEAGFDELCDQLDDRLSGRRIRSSTLIGTMASWVQKYSVTWHFAGDRRRAELVAFKMMAEFWESHTKEPQ